MRMLANENVSATVIQLLRDRGHDVLSVKESMRGEKDPAILARAQAEQRLMLTHDKDFGELIYRSGWAHAGVLLLRLQDERPGNRVHIVETVLQRYADRLPWHFTVATEGRVRIR